MVSAARVLPQQAEDGWEAGFLHPFSVGFSIGMSSPRRLELCVLLSSSRGACSASRKPAVCSLPETC